MDKDERVPSHIDEQGKNGILVKHLCGHFYAKKSTIPVEVQESYEFYARRLASYGFFRLPIVIPKESDFSEEIWFLPNLNSAKGDLFRLLERKQLTKKVEPIVVKFLDQNLFLGMLSVGTLSSYEVVISY